MIGLLALSSLITKLLEYHYWNIAIGTAFYGISHDVKEKTETQGNARGLGTQMQDVEFVYFLKLQRKIFELSTQIVTVMQKPFLNPVQLWSMINDFF